MSRFVLTAQLRLKAPTNTKQVISDLRRELQGVNIPVKIKGAAEAKKQLDAVGNSAKRASSAAQVMGKSFGLAFKRFAAFTVASRAVSLLTNSLAGAVDEAISFQREMIKISQVTGKTIQSLKGLEQTITRLSVTMGVSSKELLNTTRVLSQAGLKADELKIALSALAKTTLAPTFENISKTAEGAIAILAQFKQGVGALEQQLGAINAVAGQFAVESGDLIGAIRRTGGVFVEAGGSLEEFLGLFTSVRATTRESSESIATGLRTIFTRIQRPRTIEFLRQYGVELQHLDGSFVGPYEAVRRLNKALAGLGKGDITFIKIAEQLGGFRQIGKVIPLLKEFELAELARQAAIAGGTSLDEDKIKAQAALAVQITKVKEEFLALIRGIADTTSFQVMVKTALGLASALIKVADAIKPLLPLIGALAAFRMARGIGGFAAGFGGALKGALGKNQGGRIHAFARGGMVPGQGNRDTVPAMLQPGEFVMRKSSVKKMGAERLAAMNQNRFAKGGVEKGAILDIKRGKFGGLFLTPPDGGDGQITSQGITPSAPSVEKILAKLNKAQPQDRKALRDAARPLGPGVHGPTANAGRGALKSSRGKGVDPKTTPADFKKMMYKNKGTSPNPTALYTDFLKGKGKRTPDTDTDAAFMKFQLGKTTLTGPQNFKKVKIRVSPGAVNAYVASRSDLNQGLDTEFARAAQDGIEGMVEKVLKSKNITSIGPKNPLGKKIKGQMKSSVKTLFDKDGDGHINSAKAAIEGYLLEAVIGAVAGVNPQSSGSNFDFEGLARGGEEGWADLFGKKDAKDINRLRAADAKRSLNQHNSASIVRKIGAFLAEARNPLSKYSTLSPMAKGGSISGSDTVPALLTPGEFVLNKGASQRVGYGNLGRMNKSGVAGFAAGGKVTSGRHAYGAAPAGGGGGISGGMGMLIALPMASAALQSFTEKADGTQNALGRLAGLLTTVSTTVIAVTMAMKALGIAVTLQAARAAMTSGKGGLGDLLGGFRSKKHGGRDKTQTFAANKTIVADRSARAAELKRLRATKGAKGRIRAVKIGERGDFGEGVFPVRGTPAGRTQEARNRILSLRDKKQKLHRPGKSGTARLGRFATRHAGAKGPMGWASKALQFGGKKAAAAGAVGAGAGMGGVAAAAAAAIGPLVAIAGVVALTSMAFSALIDAKGKYKAALADAAASTTEAGEKNAIAEAERYAVMSETNGIIQAASLAFPGLAEKWIGMKAAFGGDSVKQIKAHARVAAFSAKIERNKAINAKAASEALLELKRGTMIATEALRAVSVNFALEAKRSAARKDEAAAIRETKSGIRADGSTGTWTGRNFATLGGLFGESSGEKNRRLEREAVKIEVEDEKSSAVAFSQLRSTLPAINKKFILAGASFEDMVASQDNLKGLTTGLGSQTEKLRGDYEAASKAIKANIEFIKAMNFGLRSATSAADAMSVSMDSVGKIGEGGFNSFANSAAILEAAMTSAGENISDSQMDTAIADLESTLKGFDADEKQITGATSTVRGLQRAQANAPAALEAAKAAMIAGGQDVKPQAIKEALSKEMLKGLSGVAKDKLATAFEKLDINDEMVKAIQGGNLDEVLAKTLDLVSGAASKQVIDLVKKRAEHENKLLDVIKERTSQELQFIDAQKKAIDTQLEAAKLFESFGGAKLTSDQQLGARRAQANLSLGNAGVGGLRGGGAEDIRKALSTVRNKAASQASRADVAELASARGVKTRGAFEGEAGGFDKDKRDELKTANQAIITFTKQRIQLIQEELKIAQQKNKAEKDALDKLLGGDIEGFLEGQLASAAGAALRTGDAALAGSFGAGALGAGFKTLGGQGLSGQAMERAAGFSLSSVGISDPRAAQVMAGTTAEMEAKKAEGRELSKILGEGAQQQADIEKMDVTSGEVVVHAQRVIMKSELGGAGGLARGGMVYASRGMFVSRGTDTIPAMLTPGEFVVNRASVNRGNNLSMLRAMNGGGGARGMSSGGSVGYYTNGGGAKEGGGLAGAFGAISNAVNSNIIDPLKNMFDSDSSSLAKIFGDFSTSVQKLLTLQLSVKVDPTTVTVNFNGTSFLKGMKDEIKRELLEKVVIEIKKYKPNESGDLEKRDGGI